MPNYLVITKRTDGTFDVLESFGDKYAQAFVAYCTLKNKPNGKTAVYLAEIKEEWQRMPDLNL